MSKRSIGVIALFAVVFVLGFAYQAMAAEIRVLFDNGVNETMDARQAKSQTQLAEWMSDDLVRVFARYAKSGYEAKLIEKRQDFKPQPDNYLLIVKIIKYKAGSKAARMVVGYGAGGVSLEIHYELIADGKNAILSNDDGVFSGREWINAARKLNENTAKAVTVKLSGK
jgi:hypothetical protein